ncbi:MAG TPA: hypothetical protein D7I06_06955 [Candidatus Poseidoniales archaeon]|nr:MAG TPA: hypothetical protein D7I06_06955 [Candidatus Poseidoniales archaeon]
MNIPSQIIKNYETLSGLGLMNRMDTDSWMHTQPMPMPGSPVVVTEFDAVDYLQKLPAEPQIFLWSDSDRAIPGDWSYLASVRQGVPPEGIMAEFTAWERQYPTAWLAVDLRRGVIPPSTQMPLDDLLSGMKRNVIIIVTDVEEYPQWPRWNLPF